MIYFCDACGQVYELNRVDVSCIYCGSCSCHPYETKEQNEE